MHFPSFCTVLKVYKTVSFATFLPKEAGYESQKKVEYFPKIIIKYFHIYFTLKF